VPTEAGSFGEREFTITVTYETLELYGRVEARRTFAIASD